MYVHGNHQDSWQSRFISTSLMLHSYFWPAVNTFLISLYCPFLKSFCQSLEILCFSPVSELYCTLWTPSAISDQTKQQPSWEDLSSQADQLSLDLPISSQPTFQQFLGFPKSYTSALISCFILKDSTRLWSFFKFWFCLWLILPSSPRLLLQNLRDLVSATCPGFG